MRLILNKNTDGVTDAETKPSTCHYYVQHWATCHVFIGLTK